MARTFPITSITASNGPGQPGKIAVAGDLTSVFLGRHYRNGLGDVQQLYTSSTEPVGYKTIQATQFEIVDNPLYNGRYTTFTPTTAAEESSIFLVGDTVISVVEVVPTPPNSTAASTGQITNISTYLVQVHGEPEIVVPPNIALSDRPIDLFGRSTSSWGEGYTQNFVKLAQNFANSTPPVNPFLGQSWFDVNSNVTKTFTGTEWVLSNANVFGATYKHAQTVSSATWTVQHNLALEIPYIAFVQAFKDIVGEPKMILPEDTTFTDANSLTITFSTPGTGWVLVKA